MHILFLTDNFPPETNAPASRTYEHAKIWVELGHKVTVITGVPNFPKGKIYPGYQNRLIQFEELDGIKIIRVWTYVAPNAGFARRILDFISFMITSFFASFFVRKTDIVIGTSPQFFTVISAWMVSKFKRIPFVFELRDLWPESIKTVGSMNDGFLIKTLERIELFLYHQADIIVSVTNAFKNILAERGVDKAKIHVITNGVNREFFYPQNKNRNLLAELELDGYFVAGYIGTHGLAHGLSSILDAANILMRKHRDLPIKIIMIGDGAEKEDLRKTVRSLKLDNMLLIDGVSKSKIREYWSILDLSIIHLRKSDLFNSVIPSKIFESFASGVPVLHCVSGESSDIIDKFDVGVVCEAENSEQISEQIVKMYVDRDRMLYFKENTKLAAEKYDRRTLAMEMLKVLHSTNLR